MKDDRYERLAELAKMPPGIEHVRISRWDDFFCLLNFFSQRDKGGWQWVFRGQENATWRLQSAFERELPAFEKFLKHSKRGAVARIVSEISGSEKLVIEEFRRLVSGSGLLPAGMIDAMKDGWVEWLALLQHYHAKTRLLDFTYSFAVAAYFAFEKAHTGTPRSIWALNLDVLVRRATKVMENVFRHRRERKGSDLYGEWVNIWPKDIVRTFQCDFIEVANDIIARNMDYGSGVIPIIIPGNNPRLMAQHGLFLYPTTHTTDAYSFEGNLARILDIHLERLSHLSSRADKGRRISEMHIEELKDNALLKIDFMPCMEAGAWDVLEQMQMVPRMLFPDLEGLAKGMRFDLRK